MDYTVTDVSVSDSPASQKEAPAKAFAGQTDAVSKRRPARTTHASRENAHYVALVQDNQIQRAAKAIAT